MKNHSIKELLKACDSFSHLSEEDLGILESICRVTKLPADRLIFQENDPSTSFYLIISGRVQLYKSSEEQKTIVLRIFEAGEIFAELPGLGYMNTYPASALCMEPTELLVIDGTKFRGLLGRRPDIQIHILQRASERLRNFNNVIADLSMKSVDSRLAKYLLTASVNTPEQAIIRYQKKTVASLLGTIPETLSRALRRLADKKIIVVNDHAVQILDREELTKLANGN